MKSCSHVYYGTGKGKTTAAVGLAVRAAGAGCPVLFCQFLKSGETAELSVLKTLQGVQILRPEGSYPFTRQMTEQDRLAITAEHNRILEHISAILSHARNSSADLIRAKGLSADPAENTARPSEKTSSGCLPPVVILDELAWAFHYDLIDRERVLSLLDSKIAEFVITGRIAVPELIERADYVTNLQEEKHPYQKGISARRGIEF